MEYKLLDEVEINNTKGVIISISKNKKVICIMIDGWIDNYGRRYIVKNGKIVR